MAERGKKQKKLIKGKEDPTENQAEENKSSRLTQSASSKQLEVVQHAAMEPTVPPTFYMPVSPGERKTSLPRQMSAVPQSSERKFSLRLPDIPERR